jgi:hypothetical protein
MEATTSEALNLAQKYKRESILKELINLGVIDYMNAYYFASFGENGEI